MKNEQRQIQPPVGVPTSTARPELSPSGPPTQATGGSFPEKRGHRFQDLTGQRFGRLVVVEAFGQTKYGNTTWAVRCDCGEMRVVAANSLKSGNTKSCGCLKRALVHERHFQDLTGQRFGRLVVTKVFGQTRYGNTTWAVRCDCGEARVVSAGSLKSGHTVSCGCYQREQAAAARYNPALTAEHRARRRLGCWGSEAWIKVRDRVFERDNYTCLACGKRGGVNVHHIFPWAEHEALRFDEANLVTLCAACHLRFHATYGHDCDLDDLNDFLEEDFSELTRNQ